MSLRPEISGAPVDNTVADWSESATATGATATATHALTAAKSHYICGLAFSAQGQTSVEPEEMTASLYSGSTVIWKVSFQAQVVDDNTPGSGPQFFSLTHPIKGGSGELVKLVIEGAGGYTAVYANIWGFTA